MQRQRSILSFFQKPSPEDQKSGGKAEKSAGREFSQSPAMQQNERSSVCGQPAFHVPKNSSPEVKGTDTPPEKVPRQMIPTSFTAKDNGKASSLFSSIMHKFVKVDERESTCESVKSLISIDALTWRKEINSGTSNAWSTSINSDCEVLPTEGKVFQNDAKESDLNSIKQVDQICSFYSKIGVDDIIGPETPGMKPLVPRLKRIQEDNFEYKNECSLPDSTKRQKLLQDSATGNKNNGEIFDTNSKFEWLDPCQIRDANRRKPGDALYDKRTLYIPPEALKKMSASQKQYWSIKCQYMDVVLFFKVGKFYELYELDAEIGHKELDWKMTYSGVGKCRQVGISESGIDEAVQKLVARGYKVGRMEQMETSEQAKARGSTSVIQRKLVEVVTPSTACNGNIGPDAVHLLSLKEGNNLLENGSFTYGFAFVDCTTLKFWIGSISDDASRAALGALLMQVSPKEVIYENQELSKEAQKALKKYSLAGFTALKLTPVPPCTDFVDASEVRNLIHSKGYFKVSGNSWDHALDGIMCQHLALCALGGLLGHLSRLKLDDTLCNGDIMPYQVYSGCLRIDGQTLVNLEIFSNNADGGSSGTLYKYLDNCVTSSGRRLLRNWICHPLRNAQEINNRLNVVEDLMTTTEAMSLICKCLRKLPDLERLLGQVKASVQSSALLLLPFCGKRILKQRVKVFGLLVKGLRIAVDLLVQLQKEGNTLSALSKVLKLPILSGSSGVDKLLTQFEAAIDSDFPNYENHDATDSDAEILSILIELFIEKTNQWFQVIHAINYIDVLRSFAVTANFSSGSMSRPVLLPHSTLSGETRGPLLKIKGLWHPYAIGENGGLPVPNDIYLGEDTDGNHPRTLLLTGPNMGGKSTLLRATCLAVILAQLGSYVPCEMCTLSLVDVIFTRLGATDRIMTGESTFFIECTETASVLQNATQDSLVLLDELGRGTSTFDGYAIAYAVFRHLVEKVNCRLLFATHYHPLTKEFASHPHVTLQHMACAFNLKGEKSSRGEQELVFLYQLTSGACPESYGLQVALMAGIPKEVVEAASTAGRKMKQSIGANFQSSERRSEFSTLHEEWLKTLLTVSRIGEHNFDDDAWDTLFCLWHEMKSSYQSAISKKAPPHSQVAPRKS